MPYKNTDQGKRQKCKFDMHFIKKFSQLLTSAFIWNIIFRDIMSKAIFWSLYYPIKHFTKKGKVNNGCI